MTRINPWSLETYRQPEKRSEYQTLVLNDRPFGNALAVSVFRRCASLRLCAYDFHCSIQKRRGKLKRNVTLSESHVLYTVLFSSLGLYEPNLMKGNKLLFCSSLLLYHKILVYPGPCSMGLLNESQSNLPSVYGIQYLTKINIIYFLTKHFIDRIRCIFFKVNY